jgi:hypothetical protein
MIEIAMQITVVIDIHASSRKRAEGTAIWRMNAGTAGPGFAFKRSLAGLFEKRNGRSGSQYIPSGRSKNQGSLREAPQLAGLDQAVSASSAQSLLQRPRRDIRGPNVRYPRRSVLGYRISSLAIVCNCMFDVPS